MPEIGQYTSRIMPPQGRTIPPHIGRAQSTASGIAAEGVYGIGKVLTDSGARFLEMISDAQDSIEFSKVQMDANQIHNALTDTLQTTWDDDTRKQLAEKSFNDTTAILETIRRPNVQKMFKKYLNEITPHWQASFNKIDWRMKIDKMKADTRILDEYDYEHGNKENLRMRHERNRDMGIETPIEMESIIKNYDVNSALYRSRVDIGSNEPLRVKGAIEDLEKARPSMSGAQLDEADSLLRLAQQTQTSMSDAFGKSILREMVEADKKPLTPLQRSELSENMKSIVLDPNNGLSTAESRTFLKDIDDWEKGRLKESDPTVEARILDEIRDPLSKITPKDISGLVGKGLSINDADRFINRMDVYKGFWFGRADRFLKENLGWSDETTKFLHPEGSLAYGLAMNELFDAIEKENLKDRDILDRAASISVPFLMDYWEKVLMLNPEKMERLKKMLGAKAPEVTPEQKPGKPAKKKTKTETEKNLDEIWK